MNALFATVLAFCQDRLIKLVKCTHYHLTSPSLGKAENGRRARVTAVIPRFEPVRRVNTGGGGGGVIASACNVRKCPLCLYPRLRVTSEICAAIPTRARQ